MKDVHVVDAERTPVARHDGALATVRPDDLAAHCIRELLARAPDLDPAAIGDVHLGNADGAGDENRDVARMAGLIEPHHFGLGPVEAVDRAPAKAGRAFGDLSVLELNEVFAAQVLGCLAEWPESDPAILNPQGGAIALGHPLGASGACLATTAAHQLARKGGGTGIATLCIGVGQGLALVLER